MRLRSLPLKVSLLGAAAIAAVFGVGVGVLVMQTDATIEAQTRAVQSETALSQARLVANRLDVAAKAADSIVAAVEGMHGAGATERAAYDGVLRSVLEANPALIGTWTGWEPNALDGKDKEFTGKPGTDASGRYIPYWNRGGGAVKLEALVDYDKEGPGDYYQLPKKLDRAVAIEPYVYAIAGKDTLLMSFGEPIKLGGKYAGTGGVDIDLSEVNADMAKVKPFDTGFVSVVSAAGLAVAHPDAKAAGKKLADIDAPTARVAASAISSKQRALADATGTDGAAWRYIAEPIKVGATDDVWAVVVAVPVATLEAATTQARWMMIGLSTACVLVAGLILFLLLKLLVGGPLRSLGRTVDRMAAGDYDATVVQANRADEIGTIGRAVASLRDGLKARAAADTESELARQSSATEERRTVMSRLADEFEQAVGGIVTVVSSAAGDMETAAQTLSATADEAAQQSSTVAAATEEAATNVQTVAAASEELSSSIGEIARQVAQSSSIAGKAVVEAQETDVRIQSLESAASKVGEVVNLIQAIAEQTNLLALNATIEAARAGDAGKGFAVVASEVKQLATQTAKATGDISAQIATIQAETRGSVDAIKSIGRIISEMSDIAESIASAVQQQGAATNDISRNVQEAARGTEDVARNIVGVNRATTETGSAANQILATAGQLARQSDALGEQVALFLRRVRAA